MTQFILLNLPLFLDLLMTCLLHGLDRYGTFGQLEHSGWQNNPDKARFPSTYNATPANAFRKVLNLARAAAFARTAAGAGGGLHAWVQPKEMVIGTEPTPLACPRSDNRPSGPLRLWDLLGGDHAARGHERCERLRLLGDDG